MTCQHAPRQARGLRGSALRRLAGNRCPTFYQTHDLRPNRCDTRPLPAVWQGEAMTNETTKQEVIDRISAGAVEKALDVDLPALLAPGGVLLAHVTPPSWYRAITVLAVKAWRGA